MMYRRFRTRLHRLACAAAAILLAVSAAAGEPSLRDTLRKAWAKGLQAAAAQDVFEVLDDGISPSHNAIVRVGNCSGALISPTMVLTVGHCVVDAAGLGDSPHPACQRMPGQARLAGYPQHPPYEWRRFRGGKGSGVQVTSRRDGSGMWFTAMAVTKPHCADMALLQLARKVPPHIAQPLPVMTTPPLNVDHLLGTAKLRYAGWGMPKSIQKEFPLRQTGPVQYWGANKCFVVGLPPIRRNGARIISGDSGAPLLLRDDDTEIVAGVLWGWGAIDPSVCGRVTPKPPGLHGVYTPTFRPQLDGTESTDVGHWLRTMVPDADHR